jgi:hypothetical protein
MHRVIIDGSAYVEPETAFEAAKELEKVFNEWNEKWSILPRRQARSEIQIIQENF